MAQYTHMSFIATREEALGLLEAIGAGRREIELIPFVKAMTSHDDEQTFAVIRGSSNEMSVPTQLASLLEATGLVSMDEAFAALRTRREAASGAAR